MSWSISVIGKPSAVCEEVDRQGASMSGQSKLEFDEAAPHLKALVKENFSKRPGYLEPLVHLEASGSGVSEGSAGEQIQRNCTVTLKPMYTKLV